MTFNRLGQSTLLFVTVLCAIGTIFVLSSADIHKRNYDYKTKDYDQVLLNEVTTSAFSVMEAALQRRMWEPPPDNACLKSEDFNVEGELAGGMKWKVSAKYNFTTKNYELISEGQYRDLKAFYIKRIKILDVSDYLLFSNSPNTMTLRRLYNEKYPTALIARDRRIYTKGPLQFGGNIHRPNSHMNWSGSPAGWPGEWGTIIQGDRIQFGGGMHYIQYSIPKPNPVGNNIETLLAPYAADLGTPGTHHSQFGASSVVVTRDYSKAQTLKQQVIDATPGPLSKASVANEVYPIALFGGTPPLQSWSATDSGTYFNNPDRYSIFNYAWGGANGFGIRIDATCISRSDAGTTKKICSHSEHFPRGFAKWRQDAGLEGTLFTADAEEIPSPSLNWDNMEALEEDAQACGTVISAPTSPYQDCDIWDLEFQKKYATSSGSNVCGQVSTIDMNSLALNNFNPGQLTNPALKERLLRRVVYTKVPTEIRQTAAQGLMLGSLSANAARKNFSLWVVSEDTLALRGYQQDNTSPLDTDPGRLREVVFNADATNAGKEPLPMVLLSPERVHLLSPQYVPATYNYLQGYWPVVSGQIRPVLHNYTDYIRQENDGFRYGYRTFRMENVSLITNANIDTSNPFVMRGLWSGPDSTDSQFPSNLCMVSMAGHTLTPVPGNDILTTANIPPYHSAPNSPIPPLGSRYYNGVTDRFPRSYYPAIFWVQRGAGLNATREESDLVFTGIRMYTTFDDFVPSGKRNLNTPLHTVTDTRGNYGTQFSLAHKNMQWTSSAYYNPMAAGTPCLVANLTHREAAYSSQPDYYGTQPSVNNGRYIFVHADPPVDYRNLGSIIGIDQPILETRQ
ncbi:hypothetical protein [Bdellovibrio bacteriovorus]|uniref:Uncharacterized protein n=1 Tax=Bdellovibrio bacteriovorus str. Tiberius TaxID=1069642 RepID=K7ZHE0_BDEBC|nr:hypothetical protein [Bdellovibrio bacteriovorus]AFY03417.1 hypothetical protein Bdt_3744 [Bdellovibrio bacteriovorus str. Tiberius]